MADRAIVFALANPEPEVDPAEATRARRGGGHRPLATSPTRSTTCSPSPGCSAACWTPTPTEITTPMLLAAARALAAVVTDDELNAAYIIPSVFHADVHHRGRHGGPPAPPAARPSCPPTPKSPSDRSWLDGWSLPDRGAGGLAGGWRWRAGLAVVGQLSGCTGRVRRPTPRWFPGADKVQHAVGFALPVLLIPWRGHAAPREPVGRPPRARVLVARRLGLVAHAVVSELVQHAAYAGPGRRPARRAGRLERHRRRWAAGRARLACAGSVAAGCRRRGRMTADG